MAFMNSILPCATSAAEGKPTVRLTLGFECHNSCCFPNAKYGEMCPDGTLRDAIQYLAKTVPKPEHDHPMVMIAANYLTRSAEQKYPMFFARAATLQAIYRQVILGQESKIWFNGAAEL